MSTINSPQLSDELREFFQRHIGHDCGEPIKQDFSLDALTTHETADESECQDGEAGIPAEALRRFLAKAHTPADGDTPEEHNPWDVTIPKIWGDPPRTLDPLSATAGFPYTEIPGWDISTPEGVSVVARGGPIHPSDDPALTPYEKLRAVADALGEDTCHRDALLAALKNSNGTGSFNRAKPGDVPDTERFAVTKGNTGLIANMLRRNAESRREYKVMLSTLDQASSAMATAVAKQKQLPDWEWNTTGGFSGMFTSGKRYRYEVPEGIEADIETLLSEWKARNALCAKDTLASIREEMTTPMLFVSHDGTIETREVTYTENDYTVPVEVQNAGPTHSSPKNLLKVAGDLHEYRPFGWKYHR